MKEEEKAESAGEEGIVNHSVKLKRLAAVQNDSNAEVVLSSRKRLTTEKGSAAEESEIDNTLLSGQEQAQSLDQGGQGQGGPKQEKPEEDFLAEAHSDLISDYDQEIKNGRLTKDKIHQLAVMSAIKRGNKRFCAHCQKFKPERAHHCRQCGVCVLKMDHHCPWVANCVGFYNYKFFLNMIFYGGRHPFCFLLKSLLTTFRFFQLDLLLLFTSVTYSEVIKDTILNPYVPINYSSQSLTIICFNRFQEWCCTWWCCAIQWPWSWRWFWQPFSFSISGKINLTFPRYHLIIGWSPLEKPRLSSARRSVLQNTILDAMETFRGCSVGTLWSGCSLCVKEIYCDLIGWLELIGPYVEGRGLVYNWWIFSHTFNGKLASLHSNDLQECWKIG